MKQDIKAKYPVSSEVVIRMFTDQKFHTDKLDAMGVKYKVLEHKFDGKDFAIKIERKVPLQLPGLGKGAESTVVNDERWNIASKSGKVAVSLPGMPLEVACSSQMRDVGGLCEITYTWDIKAKIPLVGGTLEKFVASDTERRTAEETKIGHSLVKNYTGS